MTTPAPVDLSPVTCPVCNETVVFSAVASFTEYAGQFGPAAMPTVHFTPISHTCVSPPVVQPPAPNVTISAPATAVASD